LAVRRALQGGVRQVDIAKEFELPEDDAPPDYEAAKLGRCPGCGGMVYVWPCIACQMATMERVLPAQEVKDEPEEIKVRPNYKQQRWKRKQILQRVFGKAG
jgi:hypothetical protein